MACGSGALDAFIGAGEKDGLWLDPRYSWRHETSRDVAYFGILHGHVKKKLAGCDLRTGVETVRIASDEWRRLLAWARSEPGRFFLFDLLLDIVFVDETVAGSAINELDECVDCTRQ